MNEFECVFVCVCAGGGGGDVGGFKSFSDTSPHLVRSDQWNQCDVKVGDKSSHNHELRRDTYRCHPSVDEVVTRHTSVLV